MTHPISVRVPRPTTGKGPARLSALAMCSVLALAACDTSNLDFDMRNAFGGPFSTADAVRNGAAPRPPADDRGVISYDNYQVVVARRGDTATTIAGRLDLEAGALARFNGLAPDTVLREGEILALPTRVPEAKQSVDIAALATDAIDRAELPDATPGTVPAPVQATPSTPLAGPTPEQHKVLRGETAYSIARLYDVSVRSLADWNGLGPELAVREGQVLLIPLATDEIPDTPTTIAATVPPGTGSETPVPPSASQPLPEPAPVAAVPESPELGQFQTAASDTASFTFPVAGRIIQDYDKAGGMDGIGIAADPGTPVVAAGDGEVAAITRDTDQVPILVLRHPGNLLTVYANVGDIAVEKGDQIKRGQQVASVAPGDPSFLHFEVREGIESVDPVPYLN